MKQHPQNEFSALMERVLAGSQEAARELVESYGPYILHVVRQKLNDQLRTKFDSRDFEQDVWASFFAELPHRQAFGSPEELIAFLIRVGRNKVLVQTRQRLLYQRCNLNRETPLDAILALGEEKLVAPQRTASEVAMGREEWDRLLQSQPVAYRRILHLLREGKSLVETANELDISERTVRRVVDRVAPWLLA